MIFPRRLGPCPWYYNLLFVSMSWSLLTLLALAPAVARAASRPASVGSNAGPVTLEIETVPHLPGIEFALDGERFVSGSDGMARSTVNLAGTRLHRLELLSAELESGDTRLQFSRWSDRSFTTARDVELPLTAPLQVGFNVFRRVTFQFVDVAGDEIDTGRISSLTINSPYRPAETHPNPGHLWLQASGPVARNGHLYEAPLSYVVEKVIVDGVNVVKRGEQRFIIGPSGEVRLQLRLFSVRFSGRDTLFGFATGSGVELEYPSRHREVHAFGPDGTVTVRALPTGAYRARLVGVPGVSRFALVQVGGAREVQVSAFSYLDALAVVDALGVVLVGLLALSVAWSARRRRRGQRAPDSIARMEAQR